MAVYLAAIVFERSAPGSHIAEQERFGQALLDTEEQRRQTKSRKARPSVLSRSRGERTRSALNHWSENKKLRWQERLGNNGLGNPYYEWYFPAGKAAPNIWIVIDQYRGRGIAACVEQSGKVARTAWVVGLIRVSSKDRLPEGTLARIVCKIGYKPAKPLTREQRAIFGAVQG